MAQPYPGYGCEQVTIVASRIPDTIVAFGQTRHNMLNTCTQSEERKTILSVVFAVSNISVRYLEIYTLYSLRISVSYLIIYPFSDNPIQNSFQFHFHAFIFSSIQQ
jgi:hypothetical protein